jgi:hypothetical protein
MEAALFQYHQAYPVTDQEKEWEVHLRDFEFECNKIRESIDTFKAKVEQLNLKDKNMEAKFTSSQLQQVREEIANQ